MRDVLTITVFFGMVFSPCFVALHAMAGEGPELGYDVTFRMIQARLTEIYLAYVDSLKI